MTMTDPIADLLTRIRNGQKAGHHSVTIPASRVKEAIVRILSEEGYITGYKRVEKQPQDALDVALKYGQDGHGAITGIVRQSKPGRRVYVGTEEIPKVRYGLGVAIVSTSRGILADHTARTKHVGGELLLTVW
jgi:small subunit ribosomal protein S8